MKQYNFLAEAVSRLTGYVYAETEQEAISKIRNHDWDDLWEENLGEIESYMIGAEVEIEEDEE